jgi:2-oxoisovalerate dehydrogenase E2 component (dihydrolipoyl transacylase)
MKIAPSPQSLRHLRHLVRPSVSPAFTVRPFLSAHKSRRHFHYTPNLQKIETHVLSDIGEGVKEVQIIQWFVEEGAQIEEWGALCEVQSDKAAVEITSKYTGVIKKLYFGRDAVVQVGDAMVDIEVEGEDEPADEESGASESKEAPEQREEQTETKAEPKKELPPDPEPEPQKSKGKHASLATPAVRGMLKEHNLKIEEIDGTGKDGRVLKEDVLNHIKKPASPSEPATSRPSAGPQTESAKALSPIQSAMFKSMTGSLNIPHFLYSDTVNITALSALRKQLNATRDSDLPKLSYMPFIIKAVSLALNKYPLLNARLDTSGGRPQLQYRDQHNISVAVDTPSGLMVPVIHSTQTLNISHIASRLKELGQKGQANKLASEDLKGGTITVSNVGSIGGEVVAPVLVEGQLAICGIGKIKTVPVFNDEGELEKAEVMTVSWSADHRVVDGATMARMAAVVKAYLEQPGSMVVDMV